MARVQPEKIVEHLKPEFRRALEATVSELFPNVPFDPVLLFRLFKRKVRSKCGTWKQVPDSCVDAT